MAVRKAGLATRIQNVSSEQTVKSAAGVLVRIVLSNGGASARTLTVKDGTSTLNVLNIPANQSEVFEMGIAFSDSLKITPSHAEVDALVVYA